MRTGRMALGLAVLFLAGGAAKAQIAMYAEATGATLQTLGTAHLYGGTFGIYDTRRIGPVSLGGDIRGAVLQRGGSKGAFTDQALDSGEIGMRVAGNVRALPLRPYAEAMVGVGSWRGGIGTARQDGNHFLMQAVGGLDCKLTQRVDWRVAEFSYGRLGAAPGFIHPMAVSMGIVLQFP